MIGSKVTTILMTKIRSLHAQFFFKIMLLLTFTMIKSIIDQLLKDSLQKNYEMTIVSESSIMALNWSKKNATRKKV